VLKSDEADRADADELDRVLERLSEAHSQLAAVREMSGRLDRAKAISERLAEQTNRSRVVKWSQVASLATELCTLLAQASRELSQGFEQLDRELRQVRDAGEQLRLVSASALLSALERTAHDQASSLGKEVAFTAKGGEVRLDAQVMQRVRGALLQLTREAVAHRLETPEERRATGKAPAGKLDVSVTRLGRRVQFAVTDDGRGAEAREVDSVRSAAAQLKGAFTASTTRGEGSTFVVTVPISLASLEGLVVEASHQAATVPLDAVVATLRLSPSEIAKAAKGETVRFENGTLPFLPLSRVLGAAAAKSAAHSGIWSAVVVQGRGGRAAIGVDRLLGTATVALRPLPDEAPVSPVVAGASVDAEGRARWVLDPDALVDAALG
jgi:two-component system chemotaxis sensor kinase CheA